MGCCGVYLDGCGDCLCPISSNVVLAGISCRELRKSAPILASAADNITFLMIYEIFSTAPLSPGSASLLHMKNCPPNLFFAFGSHRYEASLCTLSTMLLTLYVRMASRWVATLSRKCCVFLIVLTIQDAWSDAIALRATSMVVSTAIA